MLQLLFVAVLVQGFVDLPREPVLNYKLQYNAIAENDRSENHTQPYPSVVSIAFDAFGVHHEYDLELNRNLFSSDAQILVQDGDQVLAQPMRLSSYFAPLQDGWITATVTFDGLFHATVATNKDVIEVAPLRSNATAETELVAWKHSNMNVSGHLCGAKSLDSQSTTREPLNLFTVSRWQNCFPSQSGMPQLRIGFATDVGLYKRLGRNTQAVTDYINHVVAASNAVFMVQVGVALSASTYYIQTSSGGPQWNYDRTASTCPDIDTVLDVFSSWSYNNRATYAAGLWHLLTDCFPPPGTVGLGYIGTLCKAQYGTAVSSYGGGWLTVAHEIGHNFGAYHSFQRGVGTTGGIMDYGSGKYQGEYQFATPYCQTDMCRQITSSLRCTYGCVEKSKCWGTIASSPIVSSPSISTATAIISKCGNGRIDEGEQCDDGKTNGTPDSCCKEDCQLRNETICEGKDSECCTSCQMKPVSTSCRDGTGYCSNGQCITSPCATYSLSSSPCSVDPINPCQLQCNVNGKCESLIGWTTVEGKPINTSALDGSICSQTPYKICLDGVCVAG